ncbi:MAG: hypothetical protein CMQ21_09130 [Gammaproteobacteria bacterium]|nr:hypothetical protein [Gammaproteobacteria bacterium]
MLQIFIPWHESAIYEIEYIVDLSKLLRDQKVNIWIPLPVHGHDQQVLSSESFTRTQSHEIRSWTGCRLSYCSIELR